MVSISKYVTQELDKSVAQDLTEVARTLAEARHVPNDPLQSVSVLTTKIERELSQCMLLAKTRIRTGFGFCVDAVKEMARTDSTIDLEALKENVEVAFSRFESVAMAKDMCTQVMQGTSWKSLLGLDETSMQLLYKGAKKLFDSLKYPEAEAAFFFLTTIDYAQYAFWLGLGHAAFQLDNINQAINAYEMADSCQPGSIWPHIYMANCFEILHDFEEALVSLQNAELELISNVDKDENLLYEIQNRITHLKNKK